MKKRLIFKRWLEITILIVQTFLIFILCGEWENIYTDLIIKLTAILFIFINHNLLMKYSRFYMKGI